MKILKTYKHEKFSFMEAEYRKEYLTLLLKDKAFFRSICQCAFVPVPIGYTYIQTIKET